MDQSATTVRLELELEGTDAHLLFADGDTWLGSGPYAGVTVRLLEREEGHGFGLSIVVTVLVSIGVNVASNVVADAVRSAAGRLVIRARGRHGASDGSAEGLEGLVEDERDAAEADRTAVPEDLSAGPGPRSR
ncbi:hypothetical protein [Actinacidiphila acidipaludis]|uniref:Uncharacterized protein n=1 Tax=Actinacidiphila acidipaludis TaxID=2873382 RepID=A0ABS7QHL4_9ACTN|nr:hypothetical protein [Streptomyces acidipaludis]MBY8882640.1 hypothetical protein [Streptomyces acidipaludis]